MATSVPEEQGASLPLAGPPDQAGSGAVFDIMRYCVHDGPGIRTTVFLKGCPLHCSWCHNPEGQESAPQLAFREARCVRCGDCFGLCPNSAIIRHGEGFAQDHARCTACGTCTDACYAGARELIGRQMTVGEVMNEVMKDIAFFDESDGGVTFSGGEPLFQPAFLGSLLQASRELGIHTALETTGFAPMATIERIAPNVDLFLYDLKLIDPDLHRRFTGVSNRQILANLEMLVRQGKRIAVRIPVIPEITDSETNIRGIAEYVARLGSLRAIDLLPFHRIGRDKYERLGKAYGLPQLEVQSASSVEEIAAVLEGYGFTVTIGG